MNDILKRRFYLPGVRWADDRIRSLSLTGKSIFGIFVLFFSISSFVLASKVNASFLVEIPQAGGTLREGVIGTPRFINPLLSVTDGDKDIVALVYSGLMRRMPDGTLIADLAQSYTISTDGKTYDFILKNNATFQDGKPVTADDVVYTITAAQDPLTKSEKEAIWNGVTVKKVNEYEVTFTLAQPYAAFLENMTIGILPKHILINTADTDLGASNININPIGSGPYKIASVQRNSSGIPTSYTLTAFNNFILGKPQISTVVINFYSSENNMVDAYNNGDIMDMNSISPDTAEALSKQGANIVQASLPRIFAVFFNQANNPALSFSEVRQALAISVNREYIINTVLRGFGTPLQGAVPQSFVGSTSIEDASSTISQVDAANALLDKNGWKLNSQGFRELKTKTGTVPLAFSISTSDAPELIEAANIIKDEWQAIGANVTIKVEEGGYLNQNIIRPRKYDALLFGQVVNPDLDLFAFWHSTEASDPGLNVALYSNKKADKLLESMRVTLDPKVRSQEYASFNALVQNDMPAVFLYSPNFIYVMSEDVKNADIEQISVPSDRFGSIYNWYINTDKVWQVFNTTK